MQSQEQQQQHHEDEVVPPNDPTAQFWWRLVHQPGDQIPFAPEATTSSSSSFVVPGQQPQLQEQDQEQPFKIWMDGMDRSYARQQQRQQQQPALIDSMSTMTASEILEQQSSNLTEESNMPCEQQQQQHPTTSHTTTSQPTTLPLTATSRRRRRPRKLWVAASPEGDHDHYLEVAMASSTVSSGAKDDDDDHSTPVFQMLLQYSPDDPSSDAAKCNSLVSTLLHDDDDDEDDNDGDDDEEENRVEEEQQEHSNGGEADGRRASRKTISTRSPSLLRLENLELVQQQQQVDDVLHRRTIMETNETKVLSPPPAAVASNWELQLACTFDEALEDVALLLDQPPPAAAAAATNMSMKHSTFTSHDSTIHNMVLSDQAYQEAIQRAEREVEKALQQYHTTSSSSRDNKKESIPTISSKPSNRRNGSNHMNSSPASGSSSSTKQPDQDSSSHTSTTSTAAIKTKPTKPCLTVALDETREDYEDAAQAFSLTCSIPASAMVTTTTTTDSRRRQQPQQQEDVTPRRAELDRRHREQLDQLRLQNMEELSAAKACYEQETDRIRQDYERNFRTQLYRLELVKERQMAFLQERYQQQLEEHQTRAQEQMQQMKQELKMKLVDLCRDTFEREKRQAVQEAVSDLSKQIQEAREHVVFLEQERQGLLEEMDRSARQTKLQHEMDLDMVKRKVREHVEELKSLQLMEIQSLHMEKDEAIVVATKSATEFAQVGRELIAQLKRKLDAAQQKVRLLLKEKMEVAEENELVLQVVRAEHDVVQQQLQEDIAYLRRQMERQQRQQARVSHEDNAMSTKEQVATVGPAGVEHGSDQSMEQETTTTAALTLEKEAMRAENEAALQLLEEERAKRSKIVSALAQRSNQANQLLDNLLKTHDSAIAEALEQQSPSTATTTVVATPDSKHHPSPIQSANSRMPQRKPVPDPAKRAPQEPTKKVAPEPIRKVARTTRSSPTVTRREKPNSSPGILGASPKIIIQNSKVSKGKPAAIGAPGSRVHATASSSAATLVQRRVEQHRVVKVPFAVLAKDVVRRTLPPSKQPPILTEANVLDEATANAMKVAETESIPFQGNGESYDTPSTADADVSVSSNESRRENSSPMLLDQAKDTMIKPIPSQTNRSSLTAATEENDCNVGDAPFVPDQGSECVKPSVREQDVLKDLQPSTADMRVPNATKAPAFYLDFDSNLEGASNEMLADLGDLLPGNSSDIEGVDDPFRHCDDEVAVDWESAFVEKPLSVKKRVALYEYLASVSSSVSETSSNTSQSNRKSNSSPKHALTVDSDVSTNSSPKPASSVDVEDDLVEKRALRFCDV